MMRHDPNSVEVELQAMKWNQSTQSVDDFAREIQINLEKWNMFDPYSWETQKKGGDIFLQGVPPQMAAQIRIDLQKREEGTSLEAVVENGRKYWAQYLQFIRHKREYQLRIAKETGQCNLQQLGGTDTRNYTGQGGSCQNFGHKQQIRGCIFCELPSHSWVTCRLNSASPNFDASWIPPLRLKGKPLPPPQSAEQSDTVGVFFFPRRRRHQ